MLRRELYEEGEKMKTGTGELWKKPIISRSIGRQLSLEENEQNYNRKDKLNSLEFKMLLA